MGVEKSIRGFGGLGLLLLLLFTAGCTISIQPWTKPTAYPLPGEPPNGVPPPPGMFGGMMSRSNSPPNSGTTEQMVKLIKQLDDGDNQRKVLENQVTELTRKLRDREDSVRQAGLEVDSATRQMKRTRDDLGRWQGEMEDLRDRIKKLEDNRNGLKNLIEAVLRELEYDRESRKPNIGPLNLK